MEAFGSGTRRARFLCLPRPRRRDKSKLVIPQRRRVLGCTAPPCGQRSRPFPQRANCTHMSAPDDPDPADLFSGQVAHFFRHQSSARRTLTRDHRAGHQGRERRRGEDLRHSTNGLHAAWHLAFGRIRVSIRLKPPPRRHEQARRRNIRTESSTHWNCCDRGDV